MSSTTRKLVQAALPLIRTHGFTRETLSLSALHLSENAHPQPLSDSAVTALFGAGDDARRTLINAWLEEGAKGMAETQSLTTPSVRDVLQARLKYNEPVLPFLPEAFGLLTSSKSILHVVDPFPLAKHVHRIADEACIAAGEKSLQLEWHVRRACLAAIYASAEMHQLTSPRTASSFLDSLLDASETTARATDDVRQYAGYLFRSWKGIINSAN